MSQQLRERNRAVFLQMMNALGRKDWDAGFACMTEDVYCDWPYRPIPDMDEAMIGRDVVRAFFDAGQAYLKGESMSFRSAVISTGAELRFIMPVLNVPFRLIYAINPNADPLFAEKRVFRLAVGTTF